MIKKSKTLILMVSHLSLTENWNIDILIVFILKKGNSDKGKRFYS